VYVTHRNRNKWNWNWIRVLSYGLETQTNSLLGSWYLRTSRSWPLKRSHLYMCVKSNLKERGALQMRFPAHTLTTQMMVPTDFLIVHWLIRYVYCRDNVATIKKCKDCYELWTDMYMAEAIVAYSEVLSWHLFGGLKKTKHITLGIFHMILK